MVNTVGEMGEPREAGCIRIYKSKTENHTHTSCSMIIQGAVWNLLR